MKKFTSKKVIITMLSASVALTAVPMIMKEEPMSYAANLEDSFTLHESGSWQGSNGTFHQYSGVVTNLASTTSNSWTIEIPISGTFEVSTAWNVTYSTSNGILKLSNVSYNGKLAPKTTAEFGIIVKNGELDASKANISFDGSTGPISTPIPTVIPSSNPTIAPTRVPTTNPERTPVPTTSTTTKPITMDISNHNLPSNYNSIISGNEYGTLESFTYYSNITKTMRPANIILPHNYSKDKKYPVLYMLHGIGGNQNAWGSGNSCSLLTMAGNLISDGKANDMIIVMPYIRVSTTSETNIFSSENFDYYDKFREELINNLMPYMEENYSIKTGRENTAVAGFSMGGMEALYIGISRPDLFSYTAGFCPAPGIFDNSNLGVTDAGLFPSESAFTPGEQYKKDSVIMIVKGTSDTVVGDFPVTYHKALENNKVSHYYYQVDGGHEEKVWGHGYYNFLQRIFGKTVE